TIFIVHQTSGDSVLCGSASANQQIRVGRGGANVLSHYDGTNDVPSATLAVPRTNWRIDCWQPGPHWYSNGVNYDNGGAFTNLDLGLLFVLFDGATLITSGDIAAVVAYNTLLTATDRVTVETYLNHP